MSEPRRILQMLPAPDWKAAFNDEEHEGRMLAFPLICWALVEQEDGTQEVCGLYAVQRVLFCEDDPTFIGYLPPEIGNRQPPEEDIEGNGH
jgi:hypothetical protein